MHEATVAQSILNIAHTKLQQIPNAESVLVIQVIIGEFRNVDSESLQFAFDNMKSLYKGCGNCELKIEEVKSRAICKSGGHTYCPSFQQAFRCTLCNDGIGKLLCGEELDIIGITMEAKTNEELVQSTI